MKTNTSGRFMACCALFFGPTIQTVCADIPHPQVDLSVTVSTEPVPFVPGGLGTVTLTLHNSGPEAAGTTYPGPYAIDVMQSAFIITQFPPPYEIRNPVAGCLITETITEPLPDGNLALIWEFYFDVVPAGTSRTCTFDIEFYPFTRATFETAWFPVSPNDDDVNPSNDRVDYVFQAPAAPTAEAVPAATRLTLLLLAVGMFISVRFAGALSKRR